MIEVKEDLQAMVENLQDQDRLAITDDLQDHLPQEDLQAMADLEVMEGDLQVMVENLQDLKADHQVLKINILVIILHTIAARTKENLRPIIEIVLKLMVK